MIPEEMEDRKHWKNSRISVSIARVTILYDSAARKDYSEEPTVCENQKGASDQKIWGHESRIVNVTKSRFLYEKGNISISYA